MNRNFTSSIRQVHLNYDEVEVGKTAVKTIEILNESCEEQIYQVQRDPITNPLDHVFHLRSYTWILAPDEEYICEIRYRPHVAFSKNMDYFTIINSVGKCLMKITVYGSSIGPEVSCSTTKIIMCATKKNPEIKRRIKLTNNSRAAANFMIDLDEKYEVFKLDTRYGCINPHSYKYVTITFTATENESYSYHLPILILHQEPIIVSLFGYYSSSVKEESHFTFPWKEKHSFKGYMSDCDDTTGDLPLISLSKNYFDFGQADVDLENIIQRIPYAVCLTNHSDSNLLVVWEQDNERIFNITPREIQVLAKQSVLFEFFFNPNAKNNLFGREIIGLAYIEHKKQSIFPFVTSIRMIGHSFPAASNGWIPQYEIPETVIMPPCVPSFPVYTTFLIKKFGHLPLTFQFVPPSTSHFTVKPMLGVIYQSYQIITVKMASELKNEQIYVERWTIYFNGNTKNESYIDFKGYAEYANVMFCNTDGLIFAPVFPCCQQFEQLGIRNITRHKIEYTFYEIPSELHMQYPSREIDSNDTLIQECIFQPGEPHVNYDFNVQCVLIVIKNGTTIGSKSCINLHVRGRSETGLLVAIPKELYFNELEYGNTKSLSFDLFNFNVVNIYYKLISTHCNWPLGNIERDVGIFPFQGTVFSNSHEKIIISITPRTPGYYQFFIEYLIRVNCRSSTLLPKQNPVKVCIVHCMCVLPILKIINLCAFGCEQNHSVNTSKPFLWRSMQINKLNTTLQNILPGERKMLNINFFPMVINEGALFIQLFVKNPTTLSVSWILRRVQRCDCKPVIKKIGRSFQREVIECVHQTLCILYPESAILKPNKDTVISMKVNHTYVGKSEISWDLDVGHDRHVILNMLIDCLPKYDQQYDFLSPTSIKFGRIYFGNKQGIYKIYWIYNVTNNDLLYFVNIDNICKLNKAYQWEVFSCLTQSGIIEAHTARPLLLKFQPRMFGTYKVTVPITLGNKKMDLTLEGDSCCNFRSTLIGQLIPTSCVCKTTLFPVYFNVDCIDVWILPMYRSITKILFIYNHLSDALAYEWKCYDVSNILRIEVFPRKGIMSPNVVQSFRVKIYSKGQPCRIDVNIPCEFFNASERRDYQRSIIKYNILKEELEGQFVITEKGTTVPEPWIKILNKPELLCKTLTVRCSIYSVEDECLRVNLIEELKTAPSSAIYFDKSSNYNVIKNEKERYIITFVFEGLLWDIVNSRRFKKTIEESLIPKRNLYYSQFMMDLSERRRLVQRHYISPPLAHINSVLEKMLFIIIHEEFALEIAHLVPDEDARHTNYIKTLPKQNQPRKRVSIPEQFRDTLLSDDNVTQNYFTNRGSRVSFIR